MLAPIGTRLNPMANAAFLAKFVIFGSGLAADWQRIGNGLAADWQRMWQRMWQW